MQKKYVKQLVWVGCLVVMTCVAMAYTNRSQDTGITPHTPKIETKNGIVTLSGNLVQDKVYMNGNGQVSLSLTMKADDVINDKPLENRYVNMVIVLDRSGSMSGDKIEYARQAIINLLDKLTDKDRLALVTYSDNVQINSSLVNVTDTSREYLKRLVRTIYADGSTNLGGGLQEGINLLINNRPSENLSKLILISDGLANRGITDPIMLGNMASIAVEKNFSISTVGVGLDYNEMLMTLIADKGTGNYYYLDHPNSFAEVFQNEFQSTRSAVATSIEIRVPLTDGVTLVNAAGYPIQIQNNTAVFYPGDLLSGQTRNLFLTLQIPTHTQKQFEINGIQLQYRYQGHQYAVTISKPFTIACVTDPKEVIASINTKEWEKKVIQDDYNRLKEEVAEFIRMGNETGALERIKKYQDEQQAINAFVGSSQVSSNLDKDVKALENTVRDTFQGAPQAIEEKQKSNAKSLQFEGYKGRRK